MSESLLRKRGIRSCSLKSQIATLIEEKIHRKCDVEPFKEEELVMASWANRPKPTHMGITFQFVSILLNSNTRNGNSFTIVSKEGIAFQISIVSIVGMGILLQLAKKVIPSTFGIHKNNGRN